MYDYEMLKNELKNIYSKILKVNKEAAEKWLANGAQPTDTVKDLLKKAGVQ